MSDLIKRARELAALAEGDYESYAAGWFFDNLQGELSYTRCELIASAPEMAGLLEQMADELETMRRRYEIDSQAFD